MPPGDRTPFSPFPNFLRLWNLRRMDRAPEGRALRGAVARIIEDRPGLLLEIGCGFGSNAAPRRGAYLGVDPDPRVIRAAKALHPEKDFGILKEGRVALPDGAARDVLFSLVLHEVGRSARLELLAEACRVASNDVLVFDYRRDLTGWTRRRIQWNEGATFTDYLEFDLEDAMLAAGRRLVAHAPVSRLFASWIFSTLD
ncbi:MAG: class I SAM-dependent methyltransferase [Deltaproteobacteria bacterium]|nr:class I SAM-dependent methyltransferase [Deltaproteobacteria bacterium]